MNDAESSRDERFDQIIADYLDALEAGKTPDEVAMLAEHPDLAHSLKRFFLDHRRMGGLLDVPSAVQSDKDQPHSKGSGTKSPADQPTLAYDEVTSEVRGVKQVDDYLLLGKIAEGGMGVVYKARQISLNRIVALKMIRAGDFADDEEIRRFQVEAEAAAQLNHPGIVPIYQIGTASGQHYFSMAFIEGSSLAEVVRQDALPAKQAAAYVMKVARATHYAHEQGVIHRDIKPANVLLNETGEPMITDFGLAKQIRGDHELTMSGQILGTASYMPPEQASGKLDQITPQSDVYALGALLYTLLTQRPPFTGENALDVLLDVLSKDPASPSSLKIRLSRDLETICMKCLEKEPSQRYATAAALADDLERYLTARPIVARPISRDERIVRWIRRKPAYATTIVLALVLAVGGPIAFLLYRNAVSGAKRSENLTKALSSPRDYPSQRSSLINSAREHYDSTPVETEVGTEEEIYSLAAYAMLTFDRKDLSDRARSYFVALTASLENRLSSDPANDALKSALADCHLQLFRYELASDVQSADASDYEVAARHLAASRKLLEDLAATHPGNVTLARRLARAIADESELCENLLDRNRALIEAAAVSKQWDETAGLIRFEIDRFVQDTPATPNELNVLRHKAKETFEPRVQFDFAQAATAMRLHHEAIMAYGDAFSALRRSGQVLQPNELQRCFVDLALLDEVAPEGVKLISRSVWPMEPRHFYAAILGIRLADAVPRIK